jgi:hypothetical protein
MQIDDFQDEGGDGKLRLPLLWFRRILFVLNGPWLSLVERLNGVQEVVGSNPAGPISLRKCAIGGRTLAKKLQSLLGGRLIGFSARSLSTRIARASSLPAEFQVIQKSYALS